MSYIEEIIPTDSIFKFKIGKKMCKLLLEQNPEIYIKWKKQLEVLFKLELPEIIFLQIAGPYYKSIMLANWLKESSITADKEKIETILPKLKELKKLFKYTALPKDYIGLISILSGYEPNFEIFEENLEVFIRYFEEIKTVDFKNGSEFSVTSLIRHGRNSLFWMADKLNLSRERKGRKPCPYNIFIEIFIDGTSEDIAKQFSKYDAKDYLEKYNNTKNPLIKWIFDPNNEQLNYNLDILKKQLSI